MGLSKIEFDQVRDAGFASQGELDTHANNTANPHAVTKAQVGLGNLENIKSYYVATRKPEIHDDDTVATGGSDGLSPTGFTFSKGSFWVDGTTSLEKGYMCLDNTTGAAIWAAVTGIGAATVNTVISASFTGNDIGYVSKSLTGTAWFDLGRFQFPGSTIVGTPSTIQINAWRTGGTAFDIQVLDTTNGGLAIAQSLGHTAITEENIISLTSLANIPTGRSVWEVQLRKSGSGTPNGQIASMLIEF